MNKKQFKEDLKLWAKVYKKWYGICYLGKHDYGESNCAYCAKYLHVMDYPSVHCGGCPIFNRTQLIHCKETPYSFWRMYIELKDTNRVEDFKSLKLAQNELEFIKSLKPKKENY